MNMVSPVTRACAAAFAGMMAAATIAATAQTPAPAGQGAPQLTREQVLEAHTKDEKGGTASAGRALYDERCAGCHRFGGIGKDVGPDLTTITSRFKKRDILESILWPSKIISDQYQAEMFEMNDGRVITGVVIRETANAALVRTGENPDKPVVVTFAQMTARAPGTVSLMPEGLIDNLTHQQIADLLAFMMAPPPDK